MSGYANPDGPLPLTSADIDRLFKRPRGWFLRDRTRKALYAKGFPHPYMAGRWSRRAVELWFESAGANPNAVPPPHAKRRRRRQGGRGPAASGYAPA